MPQDKSQQPKVQNSMTALFAEIDNLLATSVKQEEVTQIVQSLVKNIRETDAQLTELVAKNKDMSDRDLTNVREEFAGALAVLRGRVEDINDLNGQSLETAITQLQNAVNEVQKQIPTLPDYTAQFAELEAKIPTIPEAPTGEDMRNALEALPDGDKLSIDAIQDLRKELKKLKNMSGGGGGIVGRDLIKNYDLSDQLDGVTKTFNIPAVWGIVSVACSSFPNVLRPNIDYTWTPQTITFTSEIDETTTLATGQTVVLTIVSA